MKASLGYMENGERQIIYVKGIGGVSLSFGCDGWGKGKISGWEFTSPLNPLSLRLVPQQAGRGEVRQLADRGEVTHQANDRPPRELPFPKFLRPQGEGKDEG